MKSHNTKRILCLVAAITLGCLTAIFSYLYLTEKALSGDVSKTSATANSDMAVGGASVERYKKENTNIIEFFNAENVMVNVTISKISNATTLNKSNISDFLLA